ncbi:carboxymuconolactone decarboxylase family protein [Actinacidiphila rubida]|uniref:Alkylhydroperoxidase AhpD family core domain-containing protein n=1 Tax=Actinacidiphila rubida TaxID=310780 RepID=A0A1H8T5R6_9ACTN|nr:carboxymuconolactone decarboxylase family protein [Actinacidiphila rubida]SEO85984.1 alkylhydroperoxidase AhpD family core domain-containing protein [Actinacidiphila rubida]
MEPRFNLLDSPTAAKASKRFYSASLALHESSLPRNLQELVSLRASQLNGCGWCVDIHTQEADALGETPQRLGLVAVWRHSTVFTEAERAALAFAEEATVLDGGKGVSDATWEGVRKHFDDDQLGTLVCVIGMINASNRMSLAVNMMGGTYERGMFDRLG